MSELSILKLRALKVMLTEHEGNKDKLYWDSVAKKWTIGIGRNLSDRKLEPSVIDLMFSNDVQYFYNFLCGYPWFNQLNDARQLALVDMCFMGTKSFDDFTEMKNAFALGDMERAAYEIVNSDYGRNPYTKVRADEIATIVLTGSLNSFIEGRNLHGSVLDTEKAA